MVGVLSKLQPSATIYGGRGLLLGQNTNKYKFVFETLEFLEDSLIPQIYPLMNSIEALIVSSPNPSIILNLFTP